MERLPLSLSTARSLSHHSLKSIARLVRKLPVARILLAVSPRVFQLPNLQKAIRLPNSLTQSYDDLCLEKK